MRGRRTTQARRCGVAIAALLLVEFMVLTTFSAWVVVTYLLFCTLALAALLMLIETPVGAVTAGVAVASLMAAMHRDFYVEHDGSASGEAWITFAGLSMSLVVVVAFAEMLALEIRRGPHDDELTR